MLCSSATLNDRKEDRMGRNGRDYWEMQLSEYWNSGLAIQEYSEMKELPYGSNVAGFECCKRLAKTMRTNLNRCNCPASSVVQWYAG